MIRGRCRSRRSGFARRWKSCWRIRDLGRAWPVREDGRAVGYAVMSFDSLEYGRNAWVDEIFIAKEARGKGLGERVMDFVERAAREAGVTAIHLQVNRGNKAIDLYRRRGFEEHERSLMTKSLG